MSRQRFLLVFLLVIVPNTWARCADLPALTTLHYGSSYPEIRTWHEQRRIMSRSVAQQRDDAIQMIRARYGNSGLNNLFRNLSGPGKIDFSIPGVETNLRLTTSDNRNVAIGAKRTHVYAAQLHNHSRFRLTALNQPTTTLLGKTDKDIVFQSRTSKAAGRIEIKELKPTTQRRNLAKLKRQIDKMGLARLTGERQIYVNRLPLIPELKKHLSSRGVLAFESVATGRSSTHQPGIRSFAGVLDELDEYERQLFRAKVFLPAAKTGFGVVLIAQSFQGINQAWNPMSLSRYSSRNRVDRLGYHVSIGTLGVGLTLADLGELGGPTVRRPQCLSRLGRFGGRVVPIASLAVGYFRASVKTRHLLNRLVQSLHNWSS